MTANDEIKWMVTSFASRLDTLELAVSMGNSQTGQAQDGVSEILRRLSTAEDMIKTIESLKKSLKELIHSLVLHLLGGEGVDDVEIQPPYVCEELHSQAP
ncbi:hypothetical protein CDD83_8904 [Cordyceps sp. RAO-2017]|nr:hypothetical protein CDD83_8904 [Cordyceps sp. RAO-2017]